MNKHTPGPWKYGAELSSRTGEWLISFDAGNRGRGIGIAETRPGSGQEEANARLIAAAPELLEACEAVMAWWDEHQYDSYGDADDEYNLYDEDPGMVVKARAAMAKAKGETK